MLKGSIQSILGHIEKGINYTSAQKTSFYIGELSYEWRIDESEKKLIGKDVLRDFDVVEVHFGEYFTIDEMKTLIDSYETGESKQRRKSDIKFSRAPVIKKRTSKRKRRKNHKIHK
jgi:hypothetical protein